MIAKETLNYAIKNHHYNLDTHRVKFCFVVGLG